MLQNSDKKKKHVIKNWLVREGLQLLVTLRKEEQGMCNDEKGLFETLNKKFKPQLKETIKLLQFCKLICYSNGRLDRKAKDSSG